MKRVSDIGEFGLIERLERLVRPNGLSRSGKLIGIGDDCAVLPSGVRDRYLLCTCDPVVEGSHYPAGTSPRWIGWKAMARNLSDIAAMGGIPKWAVVSIGIRRDTPVREVEALYRGLNAAAERFGCKIVGGDTTHVIHEQFVVVTLWGEVEKDKVKLRSAARPGDAVLVTGKLGGSIRGKHLRFVPRVDEARWLVSRFPVRAMMDVSDGLASDLRRLIEAGKGRIGFEIEASAVPIAAAARGNLQAALCDGEDFELLFTIAAGEVDRLCRAWRRRFKLPLTRIGRVTRDAGQIVLVRPDGNRQRVSVKGYDHFATT
jgi:thiamine-monophosphate kinase